MNPPMKTFTPFQIGHVPVGGPLPFFILGPCALESEAFAWEMARSLKEIAGRTGIHELFVVDERVRALIHEGQGEPALREAARRAGMRTLRQDGQRWVDSGVTTLEEILRVTGDD